MIEKTIFTAFNESALKHPAKPALIYKDQEKYQTISYDEVLRKTFSFADFLKSNNINRGDKVALVLENQPAFVWFFFGTMQAGAVAVPIDIQYSGGQIASLIKHSNARLVITIDKKFSEINSALPEIPCFVFNKITLIEKDNYNQSQTEACSTNSSELAALFYTSGTTDAPKAVMLTNANLLSNLKDIFSLNIVRSSDIFISLLPLHHTYAFTTTMLLPLLSGASIAYPKSLLSMDILDCLKTAKVTIFVGVPQLFILLHRSIQDKLSKFSFMKRLLINRGGDLFFALRRTTNINLAKILFKRAHVNFGGKLRFMVSGGARLDPNVEKDFYRWGFTLLEGYGLTETSPVVCFMTPRTIKFGSVGKPLPGVSVKIIEADENGHGEVIVRGDNVMQGYYRDEIQTAQVIKDGWFHTGDVGYLDKEGFLFLTGRKKELLILPNGENLNPEEIESHFLQSPFIKEIGILSYKDQLVAVIVTDEENFREQMITDIRGRLRWEIENLSSPLPSYKRIRGFAVSKDPLPRTRLGKLQRYQLPNIYKSLTQIASEKKSEATQVSEQRPEIVTGVLEYLSRKLDRRVNIKDHFEIDLGLDSLGRLETLMGIQDELGLKMSDEEMMDFFMCNTIEEMTSKFKKFFPELMKEPETAELDKLIKEGLKILSEKVNKEVAYNDHLELDLGLDSLQRVEILLELQERLGLKMNDEETMNFFMSSTVGELINKLRLKISGTQIIPDSGGISWKDVLAQEPDEPVLTKVMLDVPRRGALIFNFFVYISLRVFFKVFYRLKVKGLENLESEGNYLICPNHTTFYDGPIVSAALPFEMFLKTFFLGDSRFFDHPVLKPFTRWGRLIPIEFTYNMVTAMRVCSFVLRHKKNLCFFPEGHRSIESKLDEFKKGVGILVKENTVSVIPAYIKGAYSVWPRVNKFPKLFGNISISFGKPLLISDIKSPDIESYQIIADHIRNKVIELEQLS